MNIISILEPEWRWQKIKAYEANGETPSRKEDIYIQRGFRYLRRLNTNDSASAQFTLQQDYPDIHLAYHIYNTGAGPRWYIEALLLAGDSFEQIAEYLTYDASVIKTYEALFFNIQHKVGSRGYIMSHILAFAIERGTFDREYDFFWKLLALLLGSDGLKDYWQEGALTESVAIMLNDVLRAKLLKDAVSAAYVRKINQYNANEIIGQYLELTATEDKQSADAKHKDIASGLQSLLESVSFTVLPIDAKSENSVEPRFDLEPIGAK